MRKTKDQPTYLWAEDATTIRLRFQEEFARRLREQARVNALARYEKNKLSGWCHVNPVDISDGFDEVILEIARDLVGFKKKVLQDEFDEAEAKNEY